MENLRLAVGRVAGDARDAREDARSAQALAMQLPQNGQPAQLGQQGSPCNSSNKSFQRPDSHMEMVDMLALGSDPFSRMDEASLGW
uniref:Uncharacterized protein n=1 Tax=Sphaerodactylus townsendi TaxID=933632 RepID=A0ACB8ETA4_9SAUR